VLSAKTLKVLKDAELDPVGVALFSDEDLLGVPGVGPAVLADIRAAYPAAGVTAVDPAPLTKDAPADPPATEPKPATTPKPAAQSPVEAQPVPSAAPSGCTCDQPFRVTRTRQRGGGIERYCDVCGAVMGASPERGRG